jgi:serine protease inhibitor ecotin
MKTLYRGFELEAKREECLGGWGMVYYSIFRVSDGWEMTSGCSDDRDTLRTHIKGLKHQVDDYYEHPEYWEEDVC